MMKVALVLKDLSISGGTQRQFLELANYLQQNNDKVVVYTGRFDPKLCYPYLVKGLDIRSANLPKRQPRKVKMRLIKGLSYIGFAIIDINIRIREARRLAKLMLTDGIDFDLINAHDNEMGELFYQLRKHYKIPFVWQVNDLPVEFRVGAHTPPPMPFLNSLKTSIADFPYKKLIHVPLERHWIKNVDLITVNVEKNRRLIQKCYKRDAIVVRPGVDVSGFRPLTSKSAKDHFTILSGAVFFPYRRFEDIIIAGELLRKQYPIRIKIFGTDDHAKEYGNHLRRLVNERSLKDIVDFLGRLSEEDLLNWYQNSDVFIWANHNQSWGNAVFEAMACGTPVIVSKTAGASEVLTDRYNALLVDPLRPELLARTIEELIVDKTISEKLAQEGRRFVKTMPGDHYASRMKELFEQLSWDLH